MSTANLSSKNHQFDNWDAAQEYYLENGLTDGLPIVPPTNEKVQAMLDYCNLAPATTVSYTHLTLPTIYSV